jgi:chemotaxis protein MotB
MKRNYLYIIAILMIVTSCVPARQFQDEQERRARCEKEYQDLLASYDNLKIQHQEMTEEFTSLQKAHNMVIRDTTMTNYTLRNLQDQYDKINELYQLLLDKNRELLEGNLTETERISGELRLTQERLQKKEDELKKLEQELMAQKAQLDDLAKVLAEKEKRVTELENILAEKDRAVKELRDKVATALFGFENNGLTIEIKNGKVYVSLDESLLFASGSWSVNAKGRDALVKLAKVLETNVDVNIVIEGHTDNVPYKGSGQVKDNWDLSVMRATAIVKIIVENSNINPGRLTAAGRSEYAPVDDSNTSGGRAKNRRTEIILTPKLDELFEILELQ